MVSAELLDGGEREGCKALEEKQTTGQKGSCRKRGRVIPCELGVTSPAEIFSPQRRAWIHLWGPYSLQVTGQAKSAGLCTSETQ